MSAVTVNTLYPVFTDIDGQPLEDGYVWIGVSGLEPQANPQTAYWDAALTQVVTQPVRTRGGYPLNGTAIGRLYTANAYSIKVQNKNSSTIATELDTSIFTSSALVSFLQSGVGAVERTAQSKMRDVVSVKDFGAVGDGVANDFDAIAAAIAAVIAAGGGVVYFPSGTYLTNSSITLPNNVYLSGYGATISWGGGASPVITTATTGITSNAGIEGLIINGSTAATKLLELRSTYHCVFRDLALASTSATNICIDMLVNTSGGTDPDGTRNSVFNRFENILQEGTCGTALRMKGNSAVPTVVTLNTFVHFNCRGASVRGIDFSEWADSNYFAGVTRISLPSTAAGAVGVEWNTASPAANVGVYSNNFDHLAIDTFGVGSGRIGIKFNLTKLNKIGYYFQEPVAEGGDIVFTGNTSSFDITHSIGGTNLLAHKVLGSNYSAGGAYSNSYSIYTSAFTLTGANQASILTADTFSSSATGSVAGIAVANSTQPATFTMASYYAINVSNMNKGAGSTVNVQAGVYVADLTAGTSNYAFQSAVTAGANKWGLFLTGGARNYLGAGGVEVAAGATNMTTGFTHVPSAAGAPTGAPSNPSGNIPLYYDSTNNRLYAYNGSWRSVVLA